MIYFLGFPNVRMKSDADVRTSPNKFLPTFLDGKGPGENRQFWNLSSYWKVDILENHIQASSYSVFEATDGPADPVHQMTLPSCWVE